MARKPKTHVGGLAVRDGGWSRRRAFVMIIMSSLALWGIILGTGWGVSSAINRSSEMVFLNEVVTQLFHTGAGFFF